MKEPKTFDLNGLIFYIKDNIEFEDNQRKIAVEKANSYLQGFKDASTRIISILKASNYEIREDKADGSIE